MPLIVDKLTTSPHSSVTAVSAPTSARPYGLSLTRNFSWNLVGNVVYAGCQWGILVVLAKLTSPEMVGRFALGLAITAPIILLSWLQLRSVQATDAKGEYEFGQYLGLRIVTTLLALFVIVCIVLVGNYTLATALVILAVGLSKAFESISDVCYGLMQRHERMDHIAKSRLLKGPLSLGVLSVLVLLTRDVLWGVIGLAGIWGLFLIIYDMKNAALTLNGIQGVRSDKSSAKERMHADFSLSRLQNLAWMTLPLGIGGALISLQSSIPRIFLQTYWGEGQLGIFAALAYIIVAGNTIVAALGQSVIPRLAKYYSNNEIKRYKHLLLRMLTIGLFLALGGILLAILFGPSLLTVIYRSEYAQYNLVFVWAMIGGGMSYIASFLNDSIAATRNFRVYVPLFVIVNITTLAASIWLIPSYGLVGAALALAVGSFTQVVSGGLFVYTQCKRLEKSI